MWLGGDSVRSGGVGAQDQVQGRRGQGASRKWVKD